MSDHEREDTGVVEILSRELTAHEEEIVTATGLDDRATVADLIKVVSHVNSVGARRASADDLTRMKARVNIIWALVMSALLAAGGSTIAVVGWLKDGARDDLIKTQLVQHDVDLELRVRSLESQVLLLRQRVDDNERARWRLDRSAVPGATSGTP